MKLMEGSEAIAEASIAAGCTFFAGYPMTPFTELLEHFAKRLPEQGGVCINAESELEAVGMAWGALATGARAATGSTGQGLSLMQESFSEITLAELPLVIFNMARGQQDYYQSTRGGGHGDYRHIVLAPMDIGEAVELTQLAFHLADKWRSPVLVYGDYLIAHIQEAVDVAPARLRRAAATEGLGGRRIAGWQWPVKDHLVARLGQGGPGPSAGIERHLRAMAAKFAEIEASEVRVESGFTEDAETVVVAFGSPAKFVRYVVNQLRAEGEKVGYVRPITLWPFPYAAVADAAEGAERVGVFELCAGQMIDDVRLGVLGRAPSPASAASPPTDPASASGPSRRRAHPRQRVLALAPRRTDAAPARQREGM